MNTTTGLLELGVPRHNGDGYPDPTCYRALKEIQRAEYGYRPLVCICSPYSGDVAANVALARAFSAHAVAARKIPLAPHLLFPQFMDDTGEADRELAMFFNRVLLSKCEAIWVYTDRVSTGMRLEIEWAHHLELPTKYFTDGFEDVTL